MFRSRAPRAVVAALTAVVLIVGLMASATSAAPKPKPTPTPTPTPTPVATPTPTPTPTPTSDRRNVYFGDAPAPGGPGVLDLTPATTGNTFVFDVEAVNNGNQTLTHATFGLGGGAATRTDSTLPSLPAGVKIVGNPVVQGATCAGTPLVSDTNFSCDIGNFAAGASATVTFTMTATLPVPATKIWASFKVAENTGGDSGANKNTFIAESDIAIVDSDSNNNADFIETGPFTLSTNGQPEVPGDVQKTTVGPGPNSAAAGFISIVETNSPTGCPNAGCIGQEVALNVNDGADVTPYLEWRLDIVGLGGGSKGGVVHEEDGGNVVTIPNTPANKCSDTNTVDCIVSYTVSNKNNTTTIVFRTLTNGKTKAY